jgi:hypothetical protein
MDDIYFRTQSSHTQQSPMHHSSTQSNTANQSYIYLPAKCTTLSHRCRCTHTDSTICLHIRPTAPSLPGWVTVSSKHISIVFFLFHNHTDRLHHTLHIPLPFFHLGADGRLTVLGYGWVLSACLFRGCSIYQLRVSFTRFHLFPLRCAALFPTCLRPICHSFPVRYRHRPCSYICFQCGLT